MRTFPLCLAGLIIISLLGCETLPKDFFMPESEGQFTEKNTPEDTSLQQKKIINNHDELLVTAIGTFTEKKKFGNWEAACNTDRSVCGAILKVNDKAGNPFLSFIVQSFKKENATVSRQVMSAWLPLGFYLPEHARVSFDDQEKNFSLIAQFCSLQGCFAVSNESQAFIAAMRQGSGKVTVTMRKNISNKQKVLSFLHEGFPEAHQYITQNI